MHATEREKMIVEAMGENGFVSYKQLESLLPASPATIRRDLSKLEGKGLLKRVHGGARLCEDTTTDGLAGAAAQPLLGVPFVKSVTQNRELKQAIGLAAAKLCLPGEAIMIDGGSTTLQMCQHLAGLELQVLTNSLHIVNSLLPQPGTHILLPSGTVFREQNIILAPFGDDPMPRFHAPKLFMGAASVGPQGVMQTDVLLVAAERRLIDRAEEVILLVDSSKFNSSSGMIVCGLDAVHTVITDAGVPDEMVRRLKAANVRLIIV